MEAVRPLDEQEHRRGCGEEVFPADGENLFFRAEAVPIKVSGRNARSGVFQHEPE